MTRQKDLTIEGCEVVHSIQEGIDLAKSRGETEVFITGGGEIYKQSVELVDRIYLTEVDFEEEGEVYFPEFDEAQFKKSIVKSEEVGEKNSLAWTAYLYERI